MIPRLAVFISGSGTNLQALIDAIRAGTLQVRQRGISRYLEAKMTVYRAHIVGLHGRSIGVVQLDCIDDESAIRSARLLVDSHDVELWQMDRPVARLDAWSKQMCKK